jgi:hypothetical protein
MTDAALFKIERFGHGFAVISLPSPQVPAMIRDWYTLPDGRVITTQKYYTAGQISLESLPALRYKAAMDAINKLNAVVHELPEIKTELHLLRRDLEAVQHEAISDLIEIPTGTSKRKAPAVTPEHLEQIRRAERAAEGRGSDQLSLF